MKQFFRAILDSITRLEDHQATESASSALILQRQEQILSQNRAILEGFERIAPSLDLLDDHERRLDDHERRIRESERRLKGSHG